MTVVGLRDFRFFADIPHPAAQLPDPAEASGSVVVMRMRNMADMGSTGLRVVEPYRQRLADTGNTLVLAGVQPAALATLDRTGIAVRIGQNNIFAGGPDITRSLDDAWIHANELIDRR